MAGFPSFSKENDTPSHVHSALSSSTGPHGGSGWEGEQGGHWGWRSGRVSRDRRWGGQGPGQFVKEHGVAWGLQS